MSKSNAVALRFVVLLGFFSLCADATYEGARSITGAYLGVLGASGTVVGLVAGLGESIGYGLRLLTGFLSDRTRQYWGITTVGYALNTAVVPLMALAGRWEMLAGLMIAERTGKAIRTPPRDVLLSHAAIRVGKGFGFGLHEAMDQIGAVAGPLMVTAVLATWGSYQRGFAILVIPAVLGLVVLLIGQRIYPNPREFEPTTQDLQGEGLPRNFWIYLGAVALIAAGFVDFPLIAFHLQKWGMTQPTQIPLLYALAMGAVHSHRHPRNRCGKPRIGGRLPAKTPTTAALFSHCGPLKQLPPPRGSHGLSPTIPTVSVACSPRMTTARPFLRSVCLFFEGHR
jgi:hypothetical protein